MKILVIGGTGLIGSTIVNLLKADNHEVIAAGRSRGDFQVDIADKASLEKLLSDVGEVDGIISTCGGTGMGPFHLQTDEDIDIALNSKLKGLINTIRLGVHTVKENGFILVTTGAASHTFSPGTSSITMTNAALEGYVKAINVEQYRGVRVNAISPAFVTETAKLYGMDVPNTISVADTASVYKKVMESKESGIVADVLEYLNK